MFFPFSCFEVTKIEENNDPIGKYYDINLKNLGTYRKNIMMKYGIDFFKDCIFTGYSENLVLQKLTKNKFCIILDNYKKI